MESSGTRHQVHWAPEGKRERPPSYRGGKNKRSRDAGPSKRGERVTVPLPGRNSPKPVPPAKGEETCCPCWEGGTKKAAWGGRSACVDKLGRRSRCSPSQSSPLQGKGCPKNACEGRNASLVVEKKGGCAVRHINKRGKGKLAERGVRCPNWRTESILEGRTQSLEMLRTGRSLAITQGGHIKVSIGRRKGFAPQGAAGQKGWSSGSFLIGGCDKGELRRRKARGMTVLGGKKQKKNSLASKRRSSWGCSGHPEKGSGLSENPPATSTRRREPLWELSRLRINLQKCLPLSRCAISLVEFDVRRKFFYPKGSRECCLSCGRTMTYLSQKGALERS